MTLRTLGSNTASLGTTFATKVTGEVRSAARSDGTDQTSVLQAELDALYDAGGGTLVLPSGALGAATPIKVTNLTLKNDAASPATMPVVCVRGTGMHWSGRGSAPKGGTVIEFTGTDTYGLIKTNALGALVLTGLTLRNTTTANSTPFIYTTNTTLHIFRCAFYGAKTTTSCDQDAIILGGINQVEGGSGWTDGFQGYGTVISENFFSGIRRIAVLQAFANGVQINRNTIWATCGNSGGGAVEIDGKPGTGTQTVLGGSIDHNLFELVGYQYAVVARNTVGVSFLSNDLYDDTATTIAGIHLESTAINCHVLAGAHNGSKPYLIDDSGNSTFTEINNSGYSSIESKPKQFRGQVQIASSSGVGIKAQDTNGHVAYIKAAVPAVSPYARAYVVTKSGTTVADGVTTNTSRTVTSATAAFVASDLGQPIGGTGIPTATYIAKIVSGTTVEMTKAATADGTGVSITWGRESGSEQLQVLFEKSHIVAQGTAPAAGSIPSGITSVTITGRDIGGFVTVVAAASSLPAAGAVIANINNNIPFAGNQHIALTPRDAATAALGPCWAKPSSNNAWQIGTGATALTASATYVWSYIIMQAA